MHKTVDRRTGTETGGSVGGRSLRSGVERGARSKAAKSKGIRFVQLQFTDIMGIVKAVTIPIHQLEGSVRHGTWFDGSSIEGFTRIAESDQYLMPDMRTFSEIPWQRDGPRGTARVICDVYTPRGEPFAGDPRYVLRRQVERAQKLGYIVNTGPELEFFLFRRGEDGDDRAAAARPGRLLRLLDRPRPGRSARTWWTPSRRSGSGSRRPTTRWPPGQHEIDFEYADALQTADNAITFKFTLKAIAQQHGLYATFMPKPIHGINGSGHAHPPEPVLDRRLAERVRRRARRRTGCRRSPSRTWPGSSPTPGA